VSIQFRAKSIKMEANINNNRDQIVDVGSVVEAVSADAGDAPLYTLESLCMRCHQNVSFHHFHLFSPFFCVLIHSSSSIVSSLMQ
jgi:hypothetical protein